MVRKIKDSPEMMQYVIIYMDNDMSELKRICKKLWMGKVDSCEYDDLYDIAIESLLETIYFFDDTKSNFEAFLTGNIMRKSRTWFRDTKYRLKRNNLLVDENGNLILDEDKRPQIIKNISLDCDSKEIRNIKETIPAKEERIDDEEYSLVMQEYLENLSVIQKEMILCISEGCSKKYIQDFLDISNSEYNDNMRAITDEKNTKYIRSLI